LFESKVSNLNKTTLDNLNNQPALKVTIASSRYIFIILPGPNKTIHLLHNSILVPQGVWQEPSLIGIQGGKVTLPFRSIPLDQITKAIRSGRVTQKLNEKWTVPTLEQFLALSTEKEFENLRADQGDKTKKGPKEETDFTSIPQHLFIHPHLFGLLEGKGSATAKSAGLKLIERLQKLQRMAKDDKVEKIGEFIQQTHLTLTFIWSIGRGLADPIALENPPESDVVDEDCNWVLRRIRGDDTTAPKPSKRSKSEESSFAIPQVSAQLLPRRPTKKIGFYVKVRWLLRSATT
jgi:hypothetical protein